MTMTAPEFREVYMCKLTTPTTCYSSSREAVSSAEEPSMARAYLATEKHILGLQFEGNGDEFDPKDPTQTNDDYDVSIMEHPIPITPTGIPRRIAKKLICVGYSHHQGWEAIVLLDTSISSSQQEWRTTGGSSHEDDARTTTTAAESSANSGNRQLRRRVSSGNASVSSADGNASITSSTSVSSAPAVISIGGVGDSNTSSGSGRGSGTVGGNNSKKKKKKQLANLEEESGDDDEDEQDERYFQPIARLVVQHRGTRRQYTRLFDFRPLTPRITTLLDHSPHDISDDEEDLGHGIIGVWVGSADDTKLRLFRTDPAQDTLSEVELHGEQKRPTNVNPSSSSPMAFQFPIMAIDCITLPPTTSLDESDEREQHDLNNILAVACQDGTLRLIGYAYSGIDATVACREEYTVTVDGPIVCVHLHQKTQNNVVEAVFGSLCGYVARFLKRIETKQDLSANNINDNLSWEGPYMVAEGFKINSQTDHQEDSVLTVHAWENKVAVGTYSGRCLLYGHDDGAAIKDDYGKPFWDCQLPDSIHGICHIQAECSSLLLLVLTRQSIHLFQEIPKVYYPETAKQKLQYLLSQVIPPPSEQATSPPQQVSSNTKETADKPEDLRDVAENNGPGRSEG